VKETFGEFIRRVRTEKGLTLTQLGAQLNIDSGALSKIENGKKPLDESVLPKLAKIFKLNFNDLKDEFVSEKIAQDIFRNKCSEKVLILAEEKVRLIIYRNTKQARLKL
jgi:transcriptional regulator with XRE-family HTH domain